jgi:hypothetical protein
LSLAIAVAFGVASAGPPATAAEPTAEELAAARQLFAEAKELEKKKEWEEALARLRKVAEVKMTPQVRFHIALCEEHVGRLVAAINGFELAAEEARRAGRSAAEVAENAPRRADALRKRVGAVRIEVSGTVRTSRVLIDGKPVAPALFGTEIPLDPGAHTITVENGGKTTDSREITLAERGRDRVELVIEDPEPPPDPPPPPPPSASSAPPPPPPPPPPSRVPVFIAGGAGVAALAGAGVFFGLREMRISDVRETCTDKTQTKNCDPDAKGDLDQAKTYTTVAAVLGGVGAAGLATAGVLWFVLSPANDTTVRVAPTAGGVQVVGVF